MSTKLMCYLVCFCKLIGQIHFHHGHKYEPLSTQFYEKLFDTKNATDAPIEAEIKTIIDPKYEPYKKPDNKDNQEAGSINKTIKI